MYHFVRLEDFVYIGLDPMLLPQVQVDSGAIKFIIGGADVMCPGLTSSMGFLPDGLQIGTVVVSIHLMSIFLILILFQAIMAENKETAMAIGIMKMSSDVMYRPIRT